MPLMVRNNEKNTTVFAKEVAGSPLRVIWRASGDPHGEDIQRVPDSLADDIDFLRDLDLGIFEVLAGPEDVMAKLESAKRESSRFQAMREEAERKHLESLDRSANKDIVSEKCLECGSQVLIRASERREIPPLCSRHQHMSDQFYLVESGSKGEGATETREGQVTHEWKRPTVSRR